MVRAKLASDDNFCADWLWMHGRWRAQDDANRRLRIQSKRSILKEALDLRGLAHCTHNHFSVSASDVITVAFVWAPGWGLHDYGTARVCCDSPAFRLGRALD